MALDKKKLKFWLLEGKRKKEMPCKQIAAIRGDAPIVVIKYVSHHCSESLKNWTFP